MCRIAAWLGQAVSAVSLQQFFLDGPHSLYKQSWAPQELQYATLNADGYGVGWWPAAGQAPCAYVQDSAPWNDVNLPHLARSLTSHAWLGNVRSATAGQAVHDVNSQPFVDSTWAFTHNGYLGGFRGQVRQAIAAQLDAETASNLRGNTDSEWLFALTRSLRAEHPEPADALRAAFDWLSIQGTAEESLLNVAICDGEQLVVARHAQGGGQCPSLYMHAAHPGWPSGWLVASERFDDDKDWAPVPQHSLLVLRSGEDAIIEPLA